MQQPMASTFVVVSPSDGRSRFTLRPSPARNLSWLALHEVAAAARRGRGAQVEAQLAILLELGLARATQRFWKRRA